jgi:cell division protein ZapA
MEHEGVRVSIFDQVYHLKSGSGDRAYMEQIARYVDQKMAAIASRTQTVDSFRVAVLAALHITDELFRLRQEHEALQESIETKSLEYAALLDEVLETANSAPGGS